MNQAPSPRRPITAMPPTTPPTMAPTGAEEEEGGVGGTVVVAVDEALVVVVFGADGRRVLDPESTVWTKERPV